MGLLAFPSLLKQLCAQRETQDMDFKEVTLPLERRQVGTSETDTGG